VSDSIALRGLTAQGRHGWFAHERENGQVFVADVTLEVDTRRAASTDDLTDTIDYGEIATDVIGVLEGEPVHLVETLASRVAEVCLDRTGVEAVEVSVHKPEAPVPANLGDVTVTIRRSRA